MLREIIERGTERLEQSALGRTAALRTTAALQAEVRRIKRALRTLNINNALSSARLGLDESSRAVRQAQRARRLAALRPAWRLALAGQPERTIATANNKPRASGRTVRSEGDQPTGDAAVDEAYDYMGATYDFYWKVFNRDSIDDMGMPLNGTVHYGQDYDNAFWDGRRMIYGDGDRDQFERFTKSIDVIGHELTHGVIQNEAGLIYWGQPGALNESLADVFGSLVKQYFHNETADQADWLIGEGLFTPSVKGVAIRSLKAPGTAYNDPVLGKDPQPAHMDHYDRTIEDNGGVHINSGIPNHAFYLGASRIGGYAWERIGFIWYQTLRRPALSKTANFQDFARLTLLTAQQLFPAGPEAQAVSDAWAAVGISV
ncbi:MAG: M4 family metallopeptidase [Chromatiales bacterium]